MGGAFNARISAAPTFAKTHKPNDAFKLHIRALLAAYPTLRQIEGFVSVNKPADYTSNDIVQIVKGNVLNALEPDALKRKALRKVFKVGHGGTLDPPATGVMVIGFGDACKNFDFFLKGDKEYESTGRLGEKYDTDDLSGRLIESRPWNHVTAEGLREVCATFVGTILQKPPVYSAISIGGERLYKLAMRGKPIPEIPARPVTIYSLDVMQINLPEFRIRVKCSGGTYIRTLMYDIGVRLGSVGAMLNLQRTQQGRFRINEALQLDDTKDLVRLGGAVHKINVQW